MSCCCLLASSGTLAPRRTYRLSQNIKPLIWVECQVDKHSRSRTEYLVKARSQFKERSTATSVEILLPLPPDAISPTVRTSQASARPRAGWILLAICDTCHCHWDWLHDHAGHRSVCT